MICRNEKIPVPLSHEAEHYFDNSYNYTVAKIGDESVGGIMPIPSDAAGTPPNWGTYITVDDVDAIVKKVKALGGKVLLEPQDIPDVGRMATIQDLQGAVLMVMTYMEMTD